jgi:arsenite methyltransferase
MQSSPTLSPKQLARRRGFYGFDAPYVAATLGSIGLILLILSALFLWVFHWSLPGIIFLIFGIYMLLCTISFIYTTLRGKFQVWGELLTQLPLRGDEQILDMGCGRGMVLLMAAQLLTTGKATGVDIWSTHDQSGNAADVARRNAELENVSQRVELVTASMQKLPFPDNSFDMLFSSLAIHNIPDPAERQQVLAEAFRVLKPGGQLRIADINVVGRYPAYLHSLNMADVTYRTLGWRYWYGGPFFATRLVSARKPE